MPTNIFPTYLKVYFYHFGVIFMGEWRIWNLCKTAPKLTERKKFLRWFRRRQIVLMPWLARSPDLNPVENCWQILKRRLTKRWHKAGRRPTSRAELIAQTQEEWNSISSEAINNLVDSMPDRVLACIKARGGATKY